MQLGGRDFDEALLEIIFDRVDEQRGVDLADEVDALKNFTLAVEKCKMDLTTNESA